MPLRKDYSDDWRVAGLLAETKNKGDFWRKVEFYRSAITVGIILGFGLSAILIFSGIHFG